MPQQETFKNIFGREESASDSNVFLKNITEQYPYFGAAHFYKLKHTQPGAPDFSETAAKTALFFNDLFLLNTRLQSETSPPETFSSEANISAETVSEHSQEQKSALPAPLPQEEDALVFEPLHATDYFASQGIKLSETILDSDKLGKQLKSFTAWLKTMKKIHPEQMPVADAGADAAVRSLAEKSNAEEDVLTEAMAEAYILQDKRLKATEIYQKLSLLNPAKSAYFAAKIDNLNR